MKCLICNGHFTKRVYRGLIRRGKDKYINGSIFRCNTCGVEQNFKAYNGTVYAQSVYREMLEETNWDYDFHDRIAKWLNRFVPDTRNKVVTDVGCGGGSFLDLHKGVATDTIGVEPDSKIFGYDKHYCARETTELQSNISDITTSFDVIEHVENPKFFLSELLRLTKADGKIIVVTPNKDDILIKLHPPFKKFWYKEAHKWYWNMKSLSELVNIVLDETDYDYSINTIHRHSHQNISHWMNNEQPWTWVDTGEDATWCHYVNRLGMGENLILKIWRRA